MSRRTLLLFAIIVLGILVRVWPLPHEAVDGDELFSQRVALSSVPAAYIMVRDDLVHPPLYYFILKPVVAVLGSGPLALRLLSLLAGVLTIPLVYLLGKRLSLDDNTGLLAAALVAISRFDLYYSQEARSYAFYALLVVVLALWLGGLSNQTSRWSWGLGFLLMLSILYIHYVGAIFLALAVLALLLSRTDLALKLRVFALSVVSVLLFLPWLRTVLGAYRAQNGVGTHLSWEARPSFYDVRQIWALSLGVPEIKGATAIVLLSVAVLVLCAMTIPGLKNLRQNRLLLIALMLGVVPPPLLFVLARPPFNLSIFALRHILPATIFLCVVCCYGLLVLARAFPRYAKILYAAGCLVLLLFAAIPTVCVLTHEPSRLPYDRLELEVAQDRTQGIPTFTTWQYGIGEPVNFYCHAACVADLDTQHLPSRFLFLYRPSKGDDKRAYTALLGEGYSPTGAHFYTTGTEDPQGTAAVMLERRP